MERSYNSNILLQSMSPLVRFPITIPLVGTQTIKNLTDVLFLPSFYPKKNKSKGFGCSWALSNGLMYLLPCEN